MLERFSFLISDLSTFSKNRKLFGLQFLHVLPADKSDGGCMYYFDIL